MDTALAHKTCHKCGYVGAPADFFEPNYRNLCNECRKASKREQRKRHVVRPKVHVEQKVCTGCGTTRPREDFIPRAEARDGLDTRCTDCVNVVRRAYWERTRDRRNQYQRDRKYDLAPGEYDAMLAAQDGVCLICGDVEDGKPLAVDHDHETGRVRGLLCGPCNKGLGHFRDNTALLLKAADYLVRN